MSSLSSKLADKMRQFQRQSPVKAKMERYVPKEKKRVEPGMASAKVETKKECIDSRKRKDKTDAANLELPKRRKSEEDIKKEELTKSDSQITGYDSDTDIEGNDDDEKDKNEKTAASNDDSDETDLTANAEEESEPIVVTNIMSKTFTIDLSKEVKDYVRNLAEQALTPKPPTVYKLKMITTEALKQLLKYNDRPAYKELGKNALSAMVLDYMKLGCPPRCPKCERGALRFSNGTKKNGSRYFWCPGSTKDGIHFLNCNFKAQRGELERIPWKTPP